jgi:hypothetical protein
VLVEITTAQTLNKRNRGGAEPPAHSVMKKEVCDAYFAATHYRLAIAFTSPCVEVYLL